MQLYANELKKDIDNAVRETVAEQRCWQLRMRDERDEARSRAQECSERVAVLTESLQRIRCTSKSGLLDQLAGLEKKVRELSCRRTLNQRRVQEANLEKRRVQVAQESARRLERAFTESFLDSESVDKAQARADALQKALAEVHSQLKREMELRKKFQEIAEPPTEYFFHGGSYSIEHDLAGLEAITACHVSASRVPMLFIIFSKFFRIKLPTFTRRVHGKVAADGTKTSVCRELYRIGGQTHFKQLTAIAGEVHKFQLGEWLLRDIDAHYCYVADGANSMQQELMAHLLSRRNKQTGMLESMAVSVDAVTTKTAEGQAAGYKQAMLAATEAMEELAELGLLEPELAANLGELSASEDKEAQELPQELPQDAATFFQRRREHLRRQLRKKIAELKPSAAMNDRNATARKAARIVCGGDGTGTDSDVADGATCAHHAVANIGEQPLTCYLGLARACVVRVFSCEVCCMIVHTQVRRHARLWTPS